MREVHRNGETIGSDVFGPVSIPGLNGEVYLLNFIDYYSDYKWTIPLNTLVGADQHVIDFLVMVENHCGRRVTNFHYDQAGQYILPYEKWNATLLDGGAPHQYVH